jgi:GNAT superfamily N-acetyltransferase
MSGTFYISTDKLKLDNTVVEDFLCNRSYWAKGRSIQTVQKSIENSLCFGVYTDKNQQVGFARVVSDFAVFAWIMDLFILEGYRKKGLSKLLMQAIMNYPDLQGLERWGLGTKDAHGLYEQFGFTKLSTPETKMEKINPPQG